MAVQQLSNGINLPRVASPACGPGTRLGYPATVEQAPATLPARIAAIAQGVVGTRVRQCNIATCCKPIPKSAVMQTCQVSTTAKGCGANPSPIPAVGTLSPQADDCVSPGPWAAPQSSWKTWLTIGAIVVVLFALTGFSFRRYV